MRLLLPLLVLLPAEELQALPAAGDAHQQALPAQAQAVVVAKGQGCWVLGGRQPHRLTWSPRTFPT